MFRKTIFWSHLISGLLAGLVIFMMSLTGVLLTYERQLLHWFEQSHYVPAAEQSSTPATLDALLALGRLHAPELEPSSITVLNHPGSPVTLSAGRAGSLNLHPYTGEPMPSGSPRLEAFFSAVTGWHRWFNLSGESRATARAITGASNLVFLFLLISGLYLWFPRIWRWTMFKVRLLFVKNPPSSQARDFNWHHVMGFWCLIPLVFIVATATVFNYSWANNLVYQIYGEEAPQRGSGGGGGSPQAALSQVAEMALNENPGNSYLSLDQLMHAARQHTSSRLGDWHSLSLNLPTHSADSVEVAVNQSLGGQPQKQYTLSLDRRSGALDAVSGLSDRSPGSQTRSIIRFLHTGEVLGIWGQTLAGLVSLASLFMVWTGFALAYRRLIQPLFRKN